MKKIHYAFKNNKTLNDIYQSDHSINTLFAYVYLSWTYAHRYLRKVEKTQVNMITVEYHQVKNLF